ncbi:carboxypeptidase regulatory-like domain-containing protein [Pseudomonas sp. C2B4]|uniref:carboxypeptidase regulatory-like domain-containing protein n=1 Tax=Pseudomonas sp. C2B4 TaxID=2735270 RepID=UPI001586C50B|nr:carboxypeptidase regulatory-like domain-containing protein [Pseudomonas sp. C2B4]NUU34703.1 carboxypeptidase regulatory-like domain-containing protein [Pseudomonas sp. C2B4]
MKRFHSLMLPLATVGVLMFPALLQATTLEPINSSGVQVQRQEQNGIAYLSGGIGEDESRAIQQTTGYNLHMTFSVGPQNEYIPDVNLVIQKAPGQTVLALSEAGPLVYAQLPPGKYTVVATRNGVERRDTADVGAGAARNLVFHWNDAE